METLRWILLGDSGQADAELYAEAARTYGDRIAAIRRRAKYLLLDTDAGSALLHLGMSGSLRVLPGDTPVRAPDEIEPEVDFDIKRAA